MSPWPETFRGFGWVLYKTVSITVLAFRAVYFAWTVLAIVFGGLGVAISTAIVANSNVRNQSRDSLSTTKPGGGSRGVGVLGVKQHFVACFEINRRAFGHDDGDRCSVFICWECAKCTHQKKLLRERDRWDPI